MDRKQITVFFEGKKYIICANRSRQTRTHDEITHDFLAIDDVFTCNRADVFDKKVG